MNTEIDRMIEVMQAYKDGKQIEVLYSTSNGWQTIAVSPKPLLWNWEAYDYRIKLEPRVLYINEYEFLTGVTYQTKEEAARFARPITTRIAVKYREVIE